MGSDDGFDILLLVLVLAVLTPIMVTYSIPLFKGSVGGFDTLIEKTAQKSDGEIKPVQRSFKREDALLMAVIADKRAPEPAKLQSYVTSTSSEITISAIIANRSGYVLELDASMLGYAGELNIETYIDSVGMQRWEIRPR